MSAINPPFYAMVLIYGRVSKDPFRIVSLRVVGVPLNPR